MVHDLTSPGHSRLHFEFTSEEQDCLDTFQSGFRLQQITETTLVALHDDILREAGRGRCTQLALLDLSAAFDTINHSILLDRLSEVGIVSLA